jgi:hypothetical protein
MQKQYLYRKSCSGTQFRLGICDGYNFLTIEQRGHGKRRVSIDDNEIDAVEQRFHGINGADEFAAFVNEMCPG